MQDEAWRFQGIYLYLLFVWLFVCFLFVLINPRSYAHHTTRLMMNGESKGHFIMHLLNDDVIAVPRSELLGSLQRGTTCVFEKDSMQWIFKVLLVVLWPNC